MVRNKTGYIKNKLRAWTLFFGGDAWEGKTETLNKCSPEPHAKIPVRFAGGSYKSVEGGVVDVRHN